jgi:HK97 family phage prohead protease
MKDFNKLNFRSNDYIPTLSIDEKNKNTVSGYALKFNTLSCPLVDGVIGYRETISPEALDYDIIQSSDIFAFINHDENLGVLARSRYGKGKLQLSIDNVGLKYEFKLGKSPVCDQLRQYLEDEIITKSSFAFTIAKKEYLKNEDGTEYIDEDGLYVLRILKFDKIFDISPVYEPAYEDTNSQLRNKNNTVNQDILNEIKQLRLKEYYKKLRKKYRIL